LTHFPAVFLKSVSSDPMISCILWESYLPYCGYYSHGTLRQIASPAPASEKRMGSALYYSLLHALGEILGWRRRSREFQASSSALLLTASRHAPVGDLLRKHGAKE